MYSLRPNVNVFLSCYLFVLDKAKAEFLVKLGVIRAASDRRHQDDFPLLTLELLHGTNLEYTQTHT